MFKYFQILYRPGPLMEECQPTNKMRNFALRVAYLFCMLWSIPIAVGNDLINTKIEYVFLGVNFNLHEILEVFLIGFILMSVFFLLSLSIKTFSGRFGAKADIKEIQIGLGMGLIPWTILTAVLLFFFAYLYGQFSQLDLPTDDAKRNYLNQYSVVFPIFMALFLYGFTILLITLHKVLKINVIKTYLSFFISLAAVFFPLLFILKIFIAN